MYIQRVGYSGGSCEPVAGGSVSYSRESLGGLRFRYTVTVAAASGYTFDHWALDVPTLGPDEQFDSGTWAAIQAQLNSPTVVWDDPEEWDGGYNVGFVAHMTQQVPTTGEILYGKANLPIFGNSGKLLYKG